MTSKESAPHPSPLPANGERKAADPGRPHPMEERTFDEADGINDRVGELIPKK
jgi:hypothetical protein